MKGKLEHRLISRTRDDAAGEALDKIAKFLEMGYPGGPAIQKVVEEEGGDPSQMQFPRAWLEGTWNFSFSGLKTAVLRYLQANHLDINDMSESDRNDIAASFQFAAVKALTRNIEKALNQFDFKSVSLVGGVAANSSIKLPDSNVCQFGDCNGSAHQLISQSDAGSPR